MYPPVGGYLDIDDENYFVNTCYFFYIYHVTHTYNAHI